MNFYRFKKFSNYWGLGPRTNHIMLCFAQFDLYLIIAFKPFMCIKALSVIVFMEVRMLLNEKMAIR